jgi:hypothetical protein
MLDLECLAAGQNPIAARRTRSAAAPMATRNIPTPTGEPQPDQVIAFSAYRHSWSSLRAGLVAAAARMLFSVVVIVLISNYLGD